MSDLYSISFQNADGSTASLAAYRGQVLLIVNTASKCGFTPQYKGLEALYEKYKDRGLVVLGFPCNQFGKQEPGSNDEIQQFCALNYGVTFPVHAKLEVNGPDAHPLFVALKRRAPGLLGTEAIKWNFTKFLVSRDGQQVKRFAPKDKPENLESEIERLL
ncbi:glutathione peroxidase [Microbulbifer thermotolerans]|uniref:glutathione peroxidase n=1 Tax=Microbulbifer thermotolerans TaxID=252514 RepID=UPI0008F20834|nr:glutathione peroxidase [Microbulbifer thermotolerans]MCX2779425.1 glutathione peroxidase [Microbulbifer thermotolerans]MCX2784063.1 glutathione peroxidase [Microbulbifer thermotolerans]MCX2796482.1 glutathione peroxidase [Microbulbifer thermotolerans]MCX2806130.1 glutathione peroxidase [Microbulbifer thermotolerans]MCX2832455.1 glutathione peroxidase [Microbulbifer thermotolerans]